MTKTRAKKSPVKSAANYHHGNLRQAILEVAIALIEEGGSDAFTMREAARRVGVDHRAAYRHFADREEVLAAVSEHGFRSLTRAMNGALPVAMANAETRLLQLARSYLLFASNHPGVYRLMGGPRLNESGRFPNLENALHEASLVIAREVRRGIAPPASKKIDLVSPTLAMWSAMHGLASLVLLRRIRVRKEELGSFAERQIGYTIRGMLGSRVGAKKK